MKRVMVISLLLLSGTGAAAQNGASYSDIASQSEQSYEEEIPYELLYPALRMELPRISPAPQYGGAFSLLDFRATYLPLPALKPQPLEFVMPDAALFVSYDRFRRREGLTIPAYSVNAPRMLTGGAGYMPLYGRDNHSLGLYGSSRNYTSFGFSNSLSVGYSYSPNDWITFSGNVYASDNMYHLNRFKSFGVSGRVRVQVAERVFINGYGQYSLYNSAGSGGVQQLPLGMYPATSFGGSIEVKVAEHFGLEGGAQREYNPFTRKWETSYYVLPVFY